jgi:hypothetical protein
MHGLHNSIQAQKMAIYTKSNRSNDHESTSGVANESLSVPDPVARSLEHRPGGQTNCSLRRQHAIHRLQEIPR